MDKLLKSVTPDPRLPSQSQGIAALDRYQIILLARFTEARVCEQLAPKVVLTESGTAEIRTRDISVASPTL